MSTLVAMKVQPEKVDEVAGIINEYEEVSHNYLSAFEFQHLVHTLAESVRGLIDILNELTERTGCELRNLRLRGCLRSG